jgi:hypothetical protein
MDEKPQLEEEQKEFINPIDKDKIAEHPALLPYAHTVGGAVIRPEDMGKVKSRALSAMYEQTQYQLDQIKEQIELLAHQAQKIKDRALLSQEIYTSKMSFEPLPGHIYYLYADQQDKRILSMIGPNEWGKKKPYAYLAKVKLLSDHTWEILDSSGW